MMQPYDNLDKVKLFDFDFISEDNFLNIVLNILKYARDKKFDCKEKELPFLITPNVDQIVKFHKEDFKTLKEFYINSKYILPDGQPIVWASNLLKKPLKRRLAGSDFFPYFWSKIKGEDYKKFLIVPNDIVAKKLRKECGNCTFYVPPIFNINDRETFGKTKRNLVNLLERESPDFVFIGLGFPKQEILAMNIYKELQSKVKKLPLFLLLGASFEFYTGTKKRAPYFLQQLGLEWFYRFLQEPTRLFKRYFIDDILFFKLLLMEIIKEKKG